MNEELLQSLPQEYAGLADRRRVMLEVADELADLHGAATRLGDALEAAGMPGSAWRSQDASLRLISRKLPDITVDRFITRLAEFAAGVGPDWLHGDADDLDRFHREVQALYRVAARLSDMLKHRSPVPDGSRRVWAIERAFGDPQAMAALEAVAEILEDFRALRPFMAPLAREEWKSGAVVKSIPRHLTPLKYGGSMTYSRCRPPGTHAAARLRACHHGAALAARRPEGSRAGPIGWRTSDSGADAPSQASHHSAHADCGPCPGNGIRAARAARSASHRDGSLVVPRPGRRHTPPR